MNKSERLKTAIKHLKNSGCVKSQAEVATKMGSLPTTLSSAVNGNDKYLTDVFLRRFNDAFGKIFNIDWLIDGMGDMLCCQPTVDINQVFNAQGDNNSNTQIISSDCAVLQKENEMLKKIIEEKERTIQLLLKKNES